MKNLILSLCILVILLSSCRNHSHQVAINPELIKKYDSIVGNPDKKKHIRYDSNLWISYGEKGIRLSFENDKRSKNLWLYNNGEFITIYLVDDEMGFKGIEDANDQVAKKIIGEFIEIMQKELEISENLKRIDKILKQDFLNQDQISTLKANIFCRENLHSTNFFSKTYFVSSLLI